MWAFFTSKPSDIGGAHAEIVLSTGLEVKLDFLMVVRKINAIEISNLFLTTS
ncbi:MAG: hypothetical protein RIS87_918 [Pseudomonadota bacterium]